MTATEYSVYKYPFALTDVFTLDLPRDARIVHVEIQHGQPCLWAWVDVDAPTETRTFAVVGTGYPAPAPEDSEHIASFFMHDGAFVWHMFAAGGAV